MSLQIPSLIPMNTIQLPQVIIPASNASIPQPINLNCYPTYD